MLSIGGEGGGRAGQGDENVYDYQFPTAVKARRAVVDADQRKLRIYDASKHAAYVVHSSLTSLCSAAYVSCKIVTP